MRIRTATASPFRQRKITTREIEKDRRVSPKVKGDRGKATEGGAGRPAQTDPVPWNRQFARAVETVKPNPSPKRRGDWGRGLSEFSRGRLRRGPRASPCPRAP